MHADTGGVTKQISVDVTKLMHGHLADMVFGQNSAMFLGWDPPEVI